MRATLAITVLGAVLLLAGCSSAGEEKATDEAWSTVIKETAHEASSDFERKVLDDGRITDAEYSELQARVVDCLAGLGLKAGFDPDGSLTYTATRAAPVERDRIQKCSADNGIRTITLRDAMIRNPSNLDEGTIMVECLRRVGLVDSTYTAEMYDRGDDLERISASSLFDSCDADPLHFER